MRDVQRGWAWTRALLGIPADEIHLCGEAAAIDLVRFYLHINHVIIIRYWIMYRIQIIDLC